MPPPPSKRLLRRVPGRTEEGESRSRARCLPPPCLPRSRLRRRLDGEGGRLSLERGSPPRGRSEALSGVGNDRAGAAAVVAGEAGRTAQPLAAGAEADA